MSKKQRKAFADKLLDAIEKSGRSLYSIAQEAEITTTMLSMFVNGKRGLSMESFEKVCIVLGLDLKKD